MSIHAMTKVWEDSTRVGSELLMLLAIADYANKDGYAYPAVKTLAQKCRMTQRNANLVLSKLRASGELSVMSNRGPMGTNIYQITLQPATATEAGCRVKQDSLPPEAAFRQTLQPASAKPLENHQEPSKKYRKKSLTKKAMPEQFIISQRMREDAMTIGIAERDIEIETEKFLDHHRSKGNTFACWEAAWRNWMRNSIRFMSNKAKSYTSDLSAQKYKHGINLDNDSF